MRLIVERIIRESFRWGRSFALVVGAIQGAIVVGALWWLAGARHSAGPESTAWDIVLYNKFGVPYPVGSLVVAIVLGGLLGFVLGRLMSNEDKGQGPQAPNRQPQ
ncbi:MAG: hypothetical protein EWM72_01315 [Nitrospira sp.]|nr:MAG: hypothetical protein EWM72_01315 [Nitrospira sp.]